MGILCPNGLCAKSAASLEITHWRKSLAGHMILGRDVCPISANMWRFIISALTRTCYCVKERLGPRSLTISLGLQRLQGVLPISQSKRLDALLQLVTEELDPWSRTQSFAVKKLVRSIHPNAWVPSQMD
jgi:hypothetical protein